MPKQTAERIIDASDRRQTTPGAVAIGAATVGPHVLATSSGLGDQHTVYGLTAGQVLRASSAATALFAQLQHSDLGGVSADQHHAQAHVLASTSGLGADHTVAGLTAGQVLRASGAAAAAFAQLQHGDLGGVSANQHHNQQHSITGSDHTLTAAAWQVVGATATNTLGLLTASSNPGANAQLVATDANGYTRLKRLGINTASPIYDIDVTGSIRATDDIYADDALTVGGNLTVATVLRVNTAGTRVGINRDADSQFDLDVAGAIRGQYLVGRHAIQLTAATAVVHFDGPAPFNLDNTGSNFSHTGMAGAETGGVIYRPGKFGKAVQIAQATTNLITNPSFETDTSSPAGWTGQNVATVTASIDTATALYGGKSLKLVNTTGGQDAYYYRNIAGLSAATAYTVSAWVNCTAFTAGALSNRILLAYDTANSGATVQATTLTAATAGWVRVQVTVTMTAAPGNLQVRLYAPQATVFFDSVQVEQSTYATPYCDGSLGPGHSWSGTAHASTSSRTATRLEYPIRLVSAQAGTIMMWVKADGYNSNGGFLWNAGNANGILDSYIGSSGTLVFRVNNVQVASSANFGLATWRHVAWSWSAAANECKLFVNGVQVGSTAAYSAQPLHATLLGIGSSPTLSVVYAHNGMIDDLVLLDYVADPKLIRSIYESDAPVFVESSVVHWRAPAAAPIWVDEYGLWAQSATGNAILGVYAGDPRKVAPNHSWGGINLEDNDVLIGRSGAGYVHWDDSAQTLNVAGTITALAGSITGALTVGASGSLTAGGGKIVVDNVGVSAAVTTAWNESAAYRFMNGSTLMGGLYGYASAGLSHIALSANALPGSITPYQANRHGYLDLGALAQGAGTQAVVALSAGNYKNDLSGYRAAALTLSAPAGATVVTTARITADYFYLNDYTADRVIYHSGNDGAGSGLDADLLDGQHAAAFAAASHNHAFGDITGNGNISTTGGATIGGDLALTGGATIGGNLALTGGYMDITEIASPGNPAANKARLYVRDNGAGKTWVTIRFSDGYEVDIAKQV